MKKRFLAVDYIVLGYIAWISIMILIGFNRVDNPVKNLIELGLVTVGILVLITLNNRFNNPLLDFTRKAYALPFAGYFFESSIVTNRVFFGGFIDPWFQRIEELMWGYQPSIMWGVDFDYMWLQELMHFAYFSYYPLLLITPIYLYNKNKDHFNEFVFTTSSVFYICFFIFSWLPVIGARAFSPSFIERFPEIGQYLHYNTIGFDAEAVTTAYRHGPFTRIMAYIYTMSPHAGGAFPSSHVAVSIAIAIAIYRHIPKWNWFVIPLVFLLCVSTVYCHYHYLIDVFAGLVIASIGYFVPLRFYRKKRTTLA
ncbi:MAG: phosphatase PAP2 family protein [Candidatus Zophobacter franzmannii]|nr:phosphatase PAP2 family protein [Candidatus Zophobacter franzmannii]